MKKCSTNISSLIVFFISEENMPTRNHSFLRKKETCDDLFFLPILQFKFTAILIFHFNVCIAFRHTVSENLNTTSSYNFI